MQRVTDKNPEKGARRRTIVVSLVLVVITLSVYMRVGNYQFVNYDDEDYVTKNSHVASGLTGSNLLWAFTSVEAANWHPVTWLSHMGDVEIYGMNPRGHHLGNVIIHALSASLLLLLLLRLTGAFWPSAFVAALFALHPLHVESVAWVAERKDVLSAFFWFLTLLSYAEFAARRRPALYALTLVCFLLGLMSKPMLVTLPLVMLLLDCWPLKRVGQGAGLSQMVSSGLALVKEKIPFLACSLLSCVITIYAQAPALSGLDALAVPLRIENALISYVKYIGKTFWPVDLALLYPHRQDLPLWQAVASLLLLSIISGVTLRAHKKYPYLALGWFWFLITLLPVIGLIQVGSQSMADRYTYIPVIGLFIMVAWGVGDLTQNLPYRPRVLSLSAAAVICASATLTWQQLGYWRDSTSLYRHALQVTTDNYLMHYNLGLTLDRQGAKDQAISEYQESLRINPGYKLAHASLGTILAGKGELDAALLEYRAALLIDPAYKEVHNNMGLALARQGKLDEAIGHYREALRKSPNYLEALNNLGIALARKGDLPGAIEKFRESLRISPFDIDARNNLEHALALVVRQN